MELLASRCHCRRSRTCYPAAGVLLGAGVLAATAADAPRAQAQAVPSHLKFSNPNGIGKPAGYTHVVEMTGPGRTVYIAGQLG